MIDEKSSLIDEEMQQAPNTSIGQQSDSHQNLSKQEGQNEGAPIEIKKKANTNVDVAMKDNIQIVEADTQRLKMEREAQEKLRMKQNITKLFK